MKKPIEAEGAPSTKGYPLSHAIVDDNLIITSGQIHLGLDGKLVEGSVEDKAHQVLKNIKAILEEAGFEMKDVMKATVYVTDMDSYPKFNEVYATYFNEPYPAREVVGVNSLPLGAEFEMSVIATKKS